MSSLHGTFTWFELVCAEPEAARTFHTQTLGWTATRIDVGGVGYPMLEASGAPQAGIVSPRDEGPGHWSSYLWVDDVDARAAGVEAAGGRVLLGPVDISGVGRFALVADPQGARFNLFRGLDEQGGSTDFHWNELWARDAEQVLPFYQRAFGFEVQPMQMPSGAYYVLKNARGGQGGVMTSPEATLPPQWLPYVRLGDCDAAVDRARQRGATMVSEPTTIEGIGRLAIVSDPFGALLGFIEPPAES
ncbi:MAG: VOC family protein [Myxococcota bacterium]